MKVFCIGLNKTGTTTFGRIMRDMGYLHFSNQRAQLMNYLEDGSLNRIFDVIDPHESFDDWPYFVMYKELAEKYPNAKFVLTTRASSTKWVNSMKRHTLFMKSTLTQPQKKQEDFGPSYYGVRTPFGNEERYLEHYSRHIENVTDYFEETERSKDLLPICWEYEEDTSKLTNFLGLDSSKSGPVPHTNKGSTWSNWRIKGYEQHFENNLKEIKEDLIAKGISEADTGLTEMVGRIQSEYELLNPD